MKEEEKRNVKQAARANSKFVKKPNEPTLKGLFVEILTC